MQLQYTYRAEDLAEMQRAVARRVTPWARMRTPFWVLFFVGIATFVVFGIVNSGDPGTPWQRLKGTAKAWSEDTVFLVFAGFMVLILLYSILNRRRRFQKAIDKSPRLQQVQNLDISENGVALITALSKTEWQWTSFTALAETKNLLLLQYSLEQTYLIVPKRAVPPEAVQGLKSLIEARIPMRGAFPVSGLKGNVDGNA